MDCTILQFIIVCPMVFLAGFVDAIAGGGGLISLPAYLIAGVPTHMALGTNKMSSMMGTAIATDILHITRNSHFQALSDWLREATLTPAFQSVPMLSVLLNQAFPFWLMLFAAGFAVWKRRAYEILPMMLLLGCWGTLLLGPVVSLRYALPLIYCVPRLLEMIVGLTGKR